MNGVAGSTVTGIAAQIHTVNLADLSLILDGSFTVVFRGVSLLPVHTRPFGVRIIIIAHSHRLAWSVYAQGRKSSSAGPFCVSIIIANQSLPLSGCIIIANQSLPLSGCIIIAN